MASTMSPKESCEYSPSELVPEVDNFFPSDHGVNHQAKSKTFGDVNRDVEIVWPPMVVIGNTSVNHQWNGMGNQDLVKTFGAYSPVKARKCYDPQAHWGMSILIFRSSVDGYLEAKRLHKHFKAEERGGVGLIRHSLPGGLRGYLAKMEDLDTFNLIYQGKNKLKYEMRSYQEMVKQTALEKKQLCGSKLRVVEEQTRPDVLQQNLQALSHKLDTRSREMEIVRKRINLLHQEHNDQLESVEQFYEDRVKNMLEFINSYKPISVQNQNHSSHNLEFF